MYVAYFFFEVHDLIDQVYVITSVKKTWMMLYYTLNNFLSDIPILQN